MKELTEILEKKDAQLQAEQNKRAILMARLAHSQLHRLRYERKMVQHLMRETSALTHKPVNASRSALEPADQMPVILFTHIPKTAGGTVTNFLRSSVPPETVLFLDGPGQQPTREELRRVIENSPPARVIYGHIAFYLKVEELIGGEICRITMLRDPIQRIVSTYYFFRTIADVNPTGRRLLDENISLYDYVTKHPSRQTDNYMVRFLADVPLKDVPIGQCDGNMLEQSKSNLLNHFDIVGLTEDCESFLARVSDTFGFDNRIARPANVNKARPALEQVDKAAIHAIEERNALDIELYEFAQRLVSLHRQVRADSAHW
ncbi:MAG: sulfotransferase family 2 domain-containing protein [Chromatiales bacterium]